MQTEKMQTEKVYLREFHCPFCLSEKTVLLQCKNLLSFYFKCYTCGTKSFLNESIIDKIEHTFFLANSNFFSTSDLEDIQPIALEKIKCPFCFDASIEIKECKTKKGETKFSWRCKEGCARGFLFKRGLASWRKVEKFLENFL